MRTSTIVNFPWVDLLILRETKHTGFKLSPLVIAKDSPTNLNSVYSLGFPLTYLSQAKDSPLHKLSPSQIILPNRTFILISQGYIEENLYSPIFENPDFRKYWKDISEVIPFWVQHSLVFASIVYPGMSGGPILNTKGELVGILSRNKIDEITTIGSSLTAIKNALSKIP